jgi:hypothetical protein
MTSSTSRAFVLRQEVTRCPGCAQVLEIRQRMLPGQSSTIYRLPGKEHDAGCPRNGRPDPACTIYLSDPPVAFDRDTGIVIEPVEQWLAA